MTAIDAADRTRLCTRARQLAWATVVWNVIEALVAIIAGTAAGSAALVGFGLDSTVEVASALVIIWQFSGVDEQREQRALRLIAVSFFALATYVSIRALLDLRWWEKSRAWIEGNAHLFGDAERLLSEARADEEPKNGA